MKRGMSPLLATTLLIAFAVSFGIFAMILGNQIEAHQSQESQNISSLCDRVSLEFLSLRYKPALCVDTQDNAIRFITLNKGKLSIDSIHLVLVGDTITVRELLEEPLEPHYLYQGEVEYDVGRYGMVQEMQFIPRLIRPKSNEPYLCVNSPFVVKNISVCTT